MGLLLVIALLVIVPIVEIEVFMAVASAIGGWNALALLVVMSVVGFWLVRHEGFVLLGRMRAQLDRGEIPAAGLIDGAILLVAGLLMLVPGFVTDAVGLVLVFPPTRVAVRRTLQRRFLRRVQVFGIGVPPPARPRYSGDDVIDV